MRMMASMMNRYQLSKDYHTKFECSRYLFLEVGCSSDVVLMMVAVVDYFYSNVDDSTVNGLGVASMLPAVALFEN
jgi:hypothetical protein